MTHPPDLEGIRAIMDRYQVIPGAYVYLLCLDCPGGPFTRARIWTMTELFHRMTEHSIAVHPGAQG